MALVSASFLSVRLLCASVVECFPPTCVCIFIYAVDENNLLENVYFMMRNVNLLDIIRELKINLSVIFKSSCFVTTICNSNSSWNTLPRATNTLVTL